MRNCDTVEDAIEDIAQARATALVESLRAAVEAESIVTVDTSKGLFGVLASLNREWC